MTRRRPAHRLTSALIGAMIAALGVLTMALLSGRELDTELITIAALAAVGGWLLITALLSSRKPRSGQWSGQEEPSIYAGTASTPGTDGARDEDEPPHYEAPHTSAARSAASKAKRDRTSPS